MLSNQLICLYVVFHNEQITPFILLIYLMGHEGPRAPTQQK